MPPKNRIVGRGQKRKEGGGSGRGGNNNGGSKRGAVDLSRSWKDEEIESGDDESIDDVSDIDRDGSDDENNDSDGGAADREQRLAAETAEQKRRRLASEYLSTIQNAVGADSDKDSDEDSEDGDDIGDILRKRRLDSKGQLFRSLSSSYSEFLPDDLVSRSSSAFEGAVTSVALSNDGSSIYTASKDGSIIHHDSETGKRTFIRNRFKFTSDGSEGSSKSNEMLCVAVSSDEKYLAAGGRDKAIRIYDCRSRGEIKVFDGHRDAVTCLAFKHDSSDLFSGSLDRCMKQWNLNDMAYIETTFGHQDGISAIDCWTKSRPATASADRTVRLWKVAEESHLVYRGPKSPIDAIKLLSDDDFLTGGQDGCLHLWKALVKKPKTVVSAAHGYDNTTPRWISSIGALKMSDICLSGSYDGFLRLWRTGVDPSSLSSMGTIPMEGFINSIDIKEKNGGLLVVAGTGREHRLGRWWNLPGNKDKLHVLRIPASS